MDSRRLRQLYMQYLPHLNRALEHVNEQLRDLPPSDFLLQTNLKSYPSIKRKMQHEYVRDPAELSDLVRGRLYFSEQFSFKDMLGIIHQLFKDKVAGIDNKKELEFGLEYHGIMHVDLNFDGIHFELQLVPMEFLPYQDLLHQIYEKFRQPKSFEKMQDHEKEFLTKIHNNLYKKLDKLSKKNRK